MLRRRCSRRVQICCYCCYCCRCRASTSGLSPLLLFPQNATRRVRCSKTLMLATKNQNLTSRCFALLGGGGRHLPLPPLHEQESFVHRSGRTGRAGKDGLNIVFCSNIEDRQVHQHDLSKTSSKHKCSYFAWCCGCGRLAGRCLLFAF